MKMYHSALKEELFFPKKIISFYEKKGNSTFILNTVKDFEKIKEIKKIDLIYSEPAWEKGYKEFLNRSEDKSNSNYSEYLNSISNIILDKTIPIILIIGKHAIKKLPIFNSFLNIKLHGYLTQVYGWNIDLSIYKNKFKTNYDLIKLLSKDFNNVWDFSCGYGNTGKIFIENNKNCILTDINKKNITYIAENIL